MPKKIKCDDCPAAGTWAWFGPGLWCFDYAYFDGKSGKPKLCKDKFKTCTRDITQKEAEIIMVESKVVWPEEAKPIDIVMTEEDMRTGGWGGLCRHISAIKDRRQDYHGANQQYGSQLHIEGGFTEYAVSKLLGLKWDPKVGMILPGDLGKIEVRSTGALTSRRDLEKTHRRDMMLHDSDNFRDVPWVHITGVDGFYRVHGWIMGADAKPIAVFEDRYNKGRPAYFIPTAALRPIPELKKLVEKGRYR